MEKIKITFLRYGLFRKKIVNSQKILNMGELVYIFVLAIVVTIHEFGHYFMARWMGVRVKKMQIFFFPFYSFKPSPPQQLRGKTSWRDTTYAIGWLPFGGYTSFENRPTGVQFTDQYGQRHTMDYDTYLRLNGQSPSASRDLYYNTKPAWKRFLISIAGVLFNLITAFLIYLLFVMVSDAGSSSGFWQSLSATMEFICFTVGNTLSNILSMLGIHLFEPVISTDNYDIILSFWTTAEAHPLVKYIADLSCVLALINILPIPPLDGGQATFEVYEMITGKEPSEGFKRGAYIVGSIIFILVFWILPMIH